MCVCLYKCLYIYQLGLHLHVGGGDLKVKLIAKPNLVNNLGYYIYYGLIYHYMRWYINLQHIYSTQSETYMLTCKGVV